MSRERSIRGRDAQIQVALEPEVGPIEDGAEGDCGVEACPDAPVYRVPQPVVGGDVANCPYHLARFREHEPQLWARLREADVPDPEPYARQGAKFLRLDEVPDRIRGGDFRRVGLCQLGHGWFEADAPDKDGVVLYLEVNKAVEIVEATEVRCDDAGYFLDRINSQRGFFAWDPDVLAALYGGDRP